jgi:hypothetical protein
MRKFIVAVVLVISVNTVAQNQKQGAPIVCVSTATDSSGKSIGPLGNLNYDLAKDISEHRKPLKGLGVTADVTGHARPSAECDYVLEITLHLGGSNTIALNPPRPNPYDPAIDPRRTTSAWVVQAMYRLRSTPKAVREVEIEDSAKEEYTPQLGGYAEDLLSVATRAARVAVYDAAGRLKKKLKL